MKLHLGCGTKKWPGFVNVDLHGDPDVRSDLKVLPFDSGTADEIHAIHVWEHFYLKDAPAIMAEWVRVLRPGGLMALELPCADNVFAMIREGVTDPRMTLLPMYGAPNTHKSEADLHKWLWHAEELAQLMEMHGMTDVEFKPPKFHVPQRDMRVEGVKGGR